LIEFVHFQNIHIYSKRVKTSNVIYWGTCQYFYSRTCCKKILQNMFFMEKIKMFKKGPFVVESFITIGSFESDHTHFIVQTFLNYLQFLYYNIYNLLQLYVTCAPMILLIHACLFFVGCWYAPCIECKHVFVTRLSYVGFRLHAKWKCSCLINRWIDYTHMACHVNTHIFICTPQSYQTTHVAIC
jgi:hypothetical protein